MSVKAVKLNDHTVKMNVGARFDYSVHKEFREAYIGHKSPRLLFNVDLSEAYHMDSSALGMLLLLKEHAEKLAGKVILVQPSETVLKVLKIANFDKLFNIE